MIDRGKCWNAPCHACGRLYTIQFALCHVIEVVGTSIYTIKWSCPKCRAEYSSRLVAEGARIALAGGAQHLTVLMEEEKHDGGRPICEDDQIDFWQAWQPGGDETEDAVLQRIWKELLGDSESESKERHGT